MPFCVKFQRPSRLWLATCQETDSLTVSGCTTEMKNLIYFRPSFLSSFFFPLQPCANHSTFLENFLLGRDAHNPLVLRHHFRDSFALNSATVGYGGCTRGT